MLLVDTNIVAALHLRGPSHLIVERLYQRDRDWHSAGLLMVELVNVLATTMRVRSLPLADARRVLDTVSRQFDGRLHLAGEHDALTAAQRFAISGYDAHFIVVARALGTRLVTEDRRLRNAAPEHTCSLEEALAS